MLRLLLFVLPLGLDTLGVSISLGIKSYLSQAPGEGEKHSAFPSWLASALLFSAAETLMPLVGLGIGYVASLAISDIMHIVGPLLLIAVGLWELQEEIGERVRKRKKSVGLSPVNAGGSFASREKDHLSHRRDTSKRCPYWPPWVRQLLLALSISLDELAVGFSLGAISLSAPGGHAISPIALCIAIGLQGFLMTLIGLALGRALRERMKFVKEWLEFLSGVLLIALGIWLFLT